MRECDGLTDALLYVIQTSLGSSEIDSKVRAYVWLFSHSFTFLFIFPSLSIVLCIKTALSKIVRKELYQSYSTYVSKNKQKVTNTKQELNLFILPATTKKKHFSLRSIQFIMFYLK